MSTPQDRAALAAELRFVARGSNNLTLRERLACETGADALAATPAPAVAPVQCVQCVTPTVCNRDGRCVAGFAQVRRIDALASLPAQQVAAVTDVEIHAAFDAVLREDRAASPADEVLVRAIELQEVVDEVVEEGHMHTQHLARLRQASAAFDSALLKDTTK